MKKSTAFIAALALTGCTFTAPFCGIPQLDANAADSYKMNVTVDLSAEKKKISPYIYGVNAFDSSSVKNITTHNIRQGGNRFTGYNWETNWSNAGEDWHNSSDTNQGDIGDGPAGAVQKFSGIAAKKDIEYKLATLQMAGYVSADKDGDVTKAETAPSKRWNEVVFKKDAPFADTPDLTDDKVYMDEYVNYIVKKLGDAGSATGIQGYSLDNEPVLWNDTHPYLHPEEVSSTELITKSIDLAKAVKAVDPKAEIFGPAFWGMLPCLNCGDGSDIKDESGNKIGTYADKDWQAVKSNYFWFLDYYLESMAKAEKENGSRLLDVVDVHYYSQGINSNEDILQAARSLYDPTYTENSWFMPWGKDYFPFLQNINKSIDKYYPGTKIAISEYNLGNIGKEKETGKSIYTGIAEAEALGCFAANNVYFATYWGTLSECPYVESAINLYTNYDGKGGSFGDTLVEASTEDLSKSYAYAAINGTDDSKVNIVMGNKEKQAEEATIELKGANSKYKSATVYAVTQEDSGIRVINVQNDIKDNKLTVELPALSMVEVVLSDKESDDKVYVAPVIDVKKVEYKFDELELSVNKAPMIPIEDKEHLKKVIINCTASSSTGASWYCGGGALCFNQLKSIDGTKTYGWGDKPFSYSGTGDITVVMDSTFSIPDPEKANSSLEVEAAYADTYMEFQDWWKSSANSSSGEDVSVTYNTVTLVYEYDANETPAVTTKPADTTTTTTTTKAAATTTTTTAATTTKAAESTTTTSSKSDSTTTTTSAKPAENVIYGDANCDKTVDLSDAVLIMQSISNPDKYGLNGKDKNHITEQGQLNADCSNTGDGVTNNDALAVQKYKLALIKELPEKA